LGGKQFWADRRFFRGWRIQQNVLTGHCRLLDEHNRRHTWGTFEGCLARLDQIKRQRQLAPMQGRAVILLHGLFRTRESLAPLAKRLREQGYEVFNVGYPTTRAGVAWHAHNLAQIIEGLEGLEEIDFVAHSLGNLVIRHYLADHTDPATGRQGDPRIKRIVMLGPPNQGADLAVHLDRGPFYEWVGGRSAVQLGRAWAELEPKLATPKCQFGIIAGGSGESRGRNPLLSGDDDYVVSVEATRLSGARDFVVLPVAHTFMMNDPKVQEYTLRFLEHGHFVSEDQRRPIE
jgi:pimeloyl-ACP methyl ester carboxylesterase